MLKAMIIAGLGGFVGTCLRFLTGKLCHLLFVSAFPWGTFAVNMIGSFVIGIFFGMAEKTQMISPQMNVFLITGFCGGFTTFSTFSKKALMMLQAGNLGPFAGYVAISVVAGIALAVSAADEHARQARTP